MTNTRVTASMFYKYAACPHWLYFDKYGDPKKKSKLSSFAEQLLEMGVLHEKRIIGEQDFVEVKGRGNATRFKETLRLMKEGADRIYHGVLMTGDMVGEPDILEKRFERSSALGAYYYVAIDIKSAERITDSHKYQLFFYGELLQQTQNVRPNEGYILNGSGALLGFSLKEFEIQFHIALDEIREILHGNIPAPHVSSGCKQSPWFKECIAFAEKKHDIALLYNVKKKAIATLRQNEIRSLEDVAALDVEKFSKIASLLTPSLLERIVLQAQALLEKRHFVRKPISLPIAPYELFFDIEGDPLRQVEYLFGFLVRENGKERYEYMLAEKPDDEEKMWKQFLEWIGSLPKEYVVYHYGTYERARIATLRGRYGGSAKLDYFENRLVDLNEIIKESIVFPLYFYGIKDIGKYIGFERSGKISGGGESVAFYEEWLKNGRRKKLEEIIIYNEDDVVATRYLKDWLELQMT